MDKQRILVVDDEEDLREILKFNLESEGYLVDTAPSAEEALKMLTEEYDLTGRDDGRNVRVQDGGKTSERFSQLYPDHLFDG